MSDFLLIPADFFPHVTYIGKNQTSQSWKHEYRTISETVLFLITDGEMYLEEEAEKYHLQKGDVLLLQAGRSHGGYKLSSCCYYYVHFSNFCPQVVKSPTEDWKKKQFQKLLQQTSNENALSDTLYTKSPILFPCHFHITDNAAFYSITQKLSLALKYLSTRQPYYKTDISCCIVAMFQELSRAWLSSVFKGFSKLEDKASLSKADTLLYYLNNNYMNKITSREIEAQFKMSFDYLNRIFKKKHGSTIFAYLNQIRLDKAKQFLLTTSLSVTEIASLTGFSDVYYFSRYFKSQCHISPMAYRSQQGQRQSKED